MMVSVFYLSNSIYVLVVQKFDLRGFKMHFWCIFLKHMHQPLQGHFQKLQIIVMTKLVAGQFLSNGIWPFQACF